MRDCLLMVSGCLCGNFSLACYLRQPIPAIVLLALAFALAMWAKMLPIHD